MKEFHAVTRADYRMASHQFDSPPREGFNIFTPTTGGNSWEAEIGQRPGTMTGGPLVQLVGLPNAPPAWVAFSR